MSKIILDDDSTNLNPLRINENFRKIEEEFNEKVLYRKNPEGEPNEMENHLDMNGYRIFNLPKPTESHEPLRLSDIDLIPEEIHEYAEEAKEWAEKSKDYYEHTLEALAEGEVYIGDYGPGLTINSYTEFFGKDGIWYRPSPDLELPYTTTGDWATEGSLFVSVGDQALRQELSRSSAPDAGAELVGYTPEIGVWRKSRVYDSISRLNFESGVPVESMLPAGYVTDGSVDYTTEVQAAVDRFVSLSFPPFPILINSAGITIPSHRRLTFIDGGSLVLLPNSEANYEILRIHDVESVILNGPVIVGDRYAHTGTSGEWGMGISIRGSRDITVNDPVVSDCWGDGIYIGQTETSPANYNITINRPVCTNNRRQGISVISADGLAINNPYCSYTNGINPQSGIDIEPNGPDCLLNNIRVVGAITKGNIGAGILVDLKFFDTDGLHVDIELESPSDDGSGIGFVFTNAPRKISGSIRVNSPRSINANRNGIHVGNWNSEADIINIRNPVIVHPNKGSFSSVYEGAAISLIFPANATYDTGGVSINNPSITLRPDSPVQRTVEVIDLSFSGRSIKNFSLTEADFPANSIRNETWARLSEEGSNRIGFQELDQAVGNPLLYSGINRDAQVVSIQHSSTSRTVRMSDGSQVCFMAVDAGGNITTALGALFASPPFDITFPVPFMSGTYPVVSASVRNSRNSWTARGATDTTHVKSSLRVICTESVNLLPIVDIVVRGRWF